MNYLQTFFTNKWHKGIYMLCTIEIIQPANF